MKRFLRTTTVFLVKYVLDKPDGSTDVFYDTIFGQPGSDQGMNYVEYNGNYTSFFQEGDYTLHAYVDETLVNEVEFTMKSGRVVIPEVEVSEPEFYDSQGNRTEAFDFADYYDMALMLDFGRVTDTTRIKVSYAIRGESQSASDAKEAEFYDYVWATEDLSRGNYELVFEDIDLPLSLLYNYPLGEDLYMDIYLEDDLVHSLKLYDAADYSDSLPVVETKMAVVEHSHQEIMEDLQLLRDLGGLFDWYYGNELSLTELQTGNLAYYIVVGDLETDLVITKPLTVQFEKEDGTVVALQTETYAAWKQRSGGGYYLDVVESVNGLPYELGNHYLRIYYGDEMAMVYEEVYTIVE